MEATPPAHTTSRWRTAVRGAAIVVVALGAGALGGFVARSTSTTSAPSAAAPTACSVTAVASTDLQTVVTIAVSSATSGSTGSGEVIRPNGYILTNNHVVAAAASGGTITVLFDNGTSVPARLVGRDPLTDLAVVKVATTRSLPAIALGNSSTLRIGEPVIALGSPLGLSSTVTAGIVSALDRTISVPGEGSTTALLIDAIQTDAAINPGNSGGGLVNCAGKLVGIPSAGATVPTPTGQAASEGDIGVGFAIPIDLAKTVAGELIATGHATHAYLGLDAQPLYSDTGRTTGGLYVTTVDPGGPAATAGIRTGDIITKINGTAAVSTDQLVEVTLRQQPGTTVALQLARSGKPASATVVLGSEP